MSFSSRAGCAAAGALALALAGLFAAPPPAMARAEEVYTGLLSDLAVGGYDPVAYFREGRPVEGQRAFTHEWRGATWRFASQANLDAFRADPERYAPQYGGYCAWAAAVDKLAPGNPKHWRIVDGKLYLNYDAKVHATWERDVPGFIRKADANWPKLLEKN